MFFLLSKQGKAGDKNRLFHSEWTDTHTGVLPTGKKPMFSLFSNNVYVRINYNTTIKDFHERSN